MAISNGYCTEAEFRAWSDMTASPATADVEREIEGASRWIERYCGRKFWLSGSATALVLEADDPYCLDVPDIGSTSGLIVRTDDNYDGAFETTWSASDYLLRPVNGVVDETGEAAPYTEIQAIGTRAFPSAYTSTSRRELVQVTARWGWPSVPYAVKTACMALAADRLRLGHTQFGVATFNEFGALRVRGDNVSVASLLAPYRSGESAMGVAGFA